MVNSFYHWIVTMDIFFSLLQVHFTMCQYVFHLVKDIFRWRKLRYKGIHKNDCHANLLFASANLYMLAMG